MFLTDEFLNNEDKFNLMVKQTNHLVCPPIHLSLSFHPSDCPSSHSFTLPFPSLFVFPSSFRPSYRLPLFILWYFLMSLIHFIMIKSRVQLNKLQETSFRDFHYYLPKMCNWFPLLEKMVFEQGRFESKETTFSDWIWDVPWGSLHNLLSQELGSLLNTLEVIWIGWDGIIKMISSYKAKLISKTWFKTLDGFNVFFIRVLSSVCLSL